MPYKGRHALYTNFFDVRLDDINNPAYDDLTHPYRKLFTQWHSMAQKRQWGKMVESIFNDTQIELRLANLNHLQELTKFRQIGNYLVNCLYSKNCDLSDAIRSLYLNPKKLENDQENLVSIGTDFPCVQLMTIHASKGLEFPVVIMAGGNTGVPSENINESGFLYHEETTNETRLNLGYYGKTRCYEEHEQEAERLFYVGLTRARSIMMMAYYGTGIVSYYNSLVEFIKQHKAYYSRMTAKKGNSNDLVADILKKQFTQQTEADDSSDEKFENCLKNLTGKAWSRRLRKHSYSSLSHGKKEESPTLSIGDSAKRINKEQGGAFTVEGSDQEGTLHKEYNETIKGGNVTDYYPKGSELGSALHEVFELADYAKIGQTLEEAKANKDLITLVVRCLRKYGFKVDENDSKGWVEQSIDFIWNTLNAILPIIVGKEIKGDSFILREGAANRMAEVEFNMNVGEDFKNYCTGSVDLLISHDGVYSIIDWKTDSLDPDIYGESEELKQVVDSRYSIQRVLYAYSLIKWLKQIYAMSSEEETFNTYFGGVYYVFLRGTVGGSYAGTYSHTWESWKALEAAYNEIKNKKIDKGEGQNE